MTKFVPHNSSAVEVIHYDEQCQSLTVMYRNGIRAYDYGIVRKGTFEDITGAESVGKALREALRNGSLVPLS
jgi:hypothetical protein